MKSLVTYDEAVEKLHAHFNRGPGQKILVSKKTLQNDVWRGLLHTAGGRPALLDMDEVIRVRGRKHVAKES